MSPGRRFRRFYSKARAWQVIALLCFALLIVMTAYSVLAPIVYDRQLKRQLSRSLADANAWIRGAAIGQLINRREFWAIELLVEAFPHEQDEGFRYTIASRLRSFAVGIAVAERRGEAVDQAMRDRLTRLFIDALKDERVSEVAADALVAAMNTFEPVMAVLLQPNYSQSVRWSAARAMQATRDERAIEPLLRGLQDRNPLTRILAATALAGSLSEDPRVVDALMMAGEAKKKSGGCRVLLVPE